MREVHSPDKNRVKDMAGHPGVPGKAKAKADFAAAAGRVRDKKPDGAAIVPRNPDAARTSCRRLREQDTPFVFPDSDVSGTEPPASFGQGSLRGDCFAERVLSMKKPMPKGRAASRRQERREAEPMEHMAEYRPDCEVAGLSPQPDGKDGHDTAGRDAGRLKQGAAGSLVARCPWGQGHAGVKALSGHTVLKEAVQQCHRMPLGLSTAENHIHYAADEKRKAVHMQTS